MHALFVPALVFAVFSTALPQHPAPTLDDPTIVAIFDAANTYGIEAATAEFPFPGRP
jgi:hypothetical protein